MSRSLTRHLILVHRKQQTAVVDQVSAGVSVEDYHDSLHADGADHEHGPGGGLLGSSSKTVDGTQITQTIEGWKRTIPPAQVDSVLDLMMEPRGSQLDFQKTPFGVRASYRNIEFSAAAEGDTMLETFQLIAGEYLHWKDLTARDEFNRPTPPE